MVFLLIVTALLEFFLDGMSYRESYSSWFERCKSDEEHMMSSFADICRNKKVPLNPKVVTL